MMMLLVVDGVRGVAYAAGRQRMGHLWAPTEAHSLHQLLAFANIQGAILALHLAQETIVDEGGCLSGWGAVAGRCLAAAMAVLEGVGRHPMVGEPSMQWVDFLTFRGCQEKSPDSCESGLFIWCRRDESNTRPSHYE